MIIEHKKIDLFGKKVFEIMVIKPPLTKLNSMENEACFLHVIEGNGLSISETNKIQLQSNDSVLLKCGNYFTKMLPSSGGKYFHSFAVHFPIDVLKKVYQNEFPSFFKPDKIKHSSSFVKIENKALINHFIEGMMIYFKYPETLHNEEMLVLKLKEFLFILSQNDEYESVQDIISSLFSPNHFTLKQVVEAHLYSNVSVNELATLCNMSISTFKRDFSKAYKISPAAYLKNKKLEKAKELITISDKPISEIVFDCGFNDFSHFSKSFAQHYGKTPSEYRMSQMI